MSKHAKKLRRLARSEEKAGGSFPWIEVDDANEYQGRGAWLMWIYQVAPYKVRVEIPLTPEEDDPWLYVDDDDESLSDEESRTSAETRVGAMTRVRLLEAHRDEIRNKRTRQAGLARLRDAATAAGLFGKRERRRCIVPTWTVETERLQVAGPMGNQDD